MTEGINRPGLEIERRTLVMMMTMISLGAGEEGTKAYFANFPMD